MRDTLQEFCYNLFIYVEMPIISAVGVVRHELEGTDEEKLQRLRILVDSDHAIAVRYKTLRQITWSEYEGMCRIGTELDLFEEIFKELKASNHPLSVITPILDNKPRFDATVEIGPMMRDDLKGTPLEEPGIMVDYLDAYMTKEGFDFSEIDE